MLSTPMRMYSRIRSRSFTDQTLTKSGRPLEARISHARSIDGRMFGPRTLLRTAIPLP